MPPPGRSVNNWPEIGKIEGGLRYPRFPYDTLGRNGVPPDNYGDLFILKISDKGETKVDKRSWGRN